MGCDKCKNLSKLSEMGYRYCKIEQRFGRIRDIRVVPPWCPKGKNNPIAKREE